MRSSMSLKLTATAAASALLVLTLATSAPMPWTLPSGCQRAETAPSAPAARGCRGALGRRAGHVAALPAGQMPNYPRHPCSRRGRPVVECTRRSTMPPIPPATTRPLRSMPTLLPLLPRHPRPAYGCARWRQPFRGLGRASSSVPTAQPVLTNAHVVPRCQAGDVEALRPARVRRPRAGQRHGHRHAVLKIDAKGLARHAG